MFSAGARRSSLRPKTPGRTPGPSRFSVGRSADLATPGGVPRRFTDSEVSKDQGFAEDRVKETPQSVHTTDDGNAEVDGGLASRQNARTSSGTFGNGFASPSILPHMQPMYDEPGAGFGAPEHVRVSQNVEAAAPRLPPRNTPFESPGVGALMTRAQALDEGLGFRTAVNEVRAVVVASTKGSEEDVWRRFRGAGTLDEQMLVTREKEELQRRLGDVQRELADYRYNLGVLILEHKNCGLRIEELEDALRRTQEELHNEGRSLRLALENAARREDGLQNSLKMERAAIADLAQSLKEMHAKLEAAEETSRDRLSKAEQLEAGTSQERKHVEELGRKASRNLKAAQELEAGVKVRESEVDGKLRGLQEREQEIATREERLRKGQDDLRVAESAVREREFALADRKKSVEEELERGRKEIEQARLDGEARIEALRLSVEAERENMRRDMREAKEAAEQALAAREREVISKEENAARKEEILQALLKEAEDKQSALSARQQELEEREKLLGEEKHRMLLKEADLLDQEGNLAEERARLAEQETEWQRIESKLEAGGKELEARETAIQAREAEVKSALESVTAWQAAVTTQEQSAQLNKAELELKQESLVQLQKETDEKVGAMKKENATLERAKGDLGKREAEGAAKEQQLQTRSEELETKALELEDRERRLRVRGLELSTKEQTLAAREHQVSLRESGTEKDLQERWDALEVQRRETEADLAKQLKQLQSDKAKDAAKLKKSRAQIEEEREAVKRELQDTRAALETEFQTKVLKIQEKLGHKLMVSETERQKAVDSEVEKRVKELTEGFELKLEEKLALKLAERFAGVDGEVEKRVGELVKKRVKGLEEHREEEMERLVKERVRKEVEGQVKARVKEALQKAKEETNAKFEREKEAAIQKALKAAEKRAEDERKAAVASAKEEAKKESERETRVAVQEALKTAERRAEDERKAAVASAKEQARKEFEREADTTVQMALQTAEKRAENERKAAVERTEEEARKESEKETKRAVQKALKAAEKSAENERKAAVLSAQEDARKNSEKETEIAVQEALKAAERRAEDERKAAIASAKEDARKQFEKETETAVQKALKTAEKRAEEEKKAAVLSAVARAKEEARKVHEEETESAIQVAFGVAEKKGEDEKKAAVASAREDARKRVEQETETAVRRALEAAKKKAGEEKLAAVTRAKEEERAKFEREKQSAIHQALEELENKTEDGKRVAVAKAKDEARARLEREKQEAIDEALQVAELKKMAAVATALEVARMDFEQEKATAVRDAVKTAETKLETEKQAAIASAKASFEQDRAAGVRNAVEAAEQKAEKEKKAAVAAAVKDAGTAERTRLAGVKRAADEDRRESEAGPGELENVEEPGPAKVSDVAHNEEVPKRGWLGMLSPRRPIRTPQPAAEIVAVRSASETLPVGTAARELEPVSVSANPVESPAVDLGAIPTEPGPAEPASVTVFNTPKTSKPSGKRKLSQPTSGERPPKQRKGSRRKDEKLEAGENGIVKGPVEALGAAVTAVGRAADAVTGPFGFVLDDTDLGFVPGSTETQAEREQGVKKPSWSLWPGFLSPRKLKPSEETPDAAETAPETKLVPVGWDEPSTEAPPLEVAGAKEGEGGSLTEGEVTPPLVAMAERDVGMAPQSGSVLGKTTSEIDLRSTDSETLREQPSLVSKTPKRGGTKTPKPSRTPKPFPPAVRASSRLRERALSSELSGSLEPPAASQLPALAEVPGRGSPGEGQEGSLATEEAANGSSSLRGHRSLTPEEQAKLDRLLESFEAEEQAIANEEAVLNPLTPVVLKPPTLTENVPPLEHEPLADPMPALGNLTPDARTPDALTPGLEPAAGRLGPLTSELTLKDMGDSPAELQPFGTPGLESSKGVVKRTSGGVRSVERLKKEDLLRARAARAAGRTSDTFLTEAEMAKGQDLPNDDLEETPEIPPGGASPVVDADPIERSPMSDSPPVLKTTLPPKTPKSAFGRMFGSFFGSSKSPVGDECQEGSLEGEEGAYKSQAKDLRSIVDDLVGAADRDEKMGGSGRQETDPPEGDEQSEGGPETLAFNTPAGSERDLEFTTPLEGAFTQWGGSEPAGFAGIAQSALESAGTVLEAAVSEGKQLGGEVLRKTRIRAFDLNEKAAEIADEVVGVAAADVAADVADDVIALGAVAGQVAEALTGNIGEALAAETLEEGGFHTGAGAGESLVGMGLEGTLGGAADGGGVGLRPRSSRDPTPSYGTAIEEGAPSGTGPVRGVQLGAKTGGGNEAQSLQRRGSKRKAAQSESKGKQVKETEADTGDEGASNRTRVRKRVKGAESGDETELLDPRVVDFAAKFDGIEEQELETDVSETGRRRKRSKSVVDPRDGEDVTAGLRRYNLRKSTLVKMHVWEPRGEDFDTGADNEGIHTRTGVASTPRNLRRSVFGGDNPFLEDIAPGNPHSLEEIRTPRTSRGARGERGAAAPQDEEAEQANAGWRWLGFLGW